MALGDVQSTIASVANNSFLNVQPGAGVEWVIHNFHHAGGAELQFFDGTNFILLDTDTEGGVWSGAFHVTNLVYYRVKNTSGGTVNLGYDGVQTK